MRWLIFFLVLVLLVLAMPAYANNYAGKIVPVLFVPRDRQTEGVEKIKDQIRIKIQDALDFYARERQIHGFGDKDLIATSVKVVIGSYSHYYYENQNWLSCWTEVAEILTGDTYVEESFAIFLYKDYGDKRTPAGAFSTDQGGVAFMPMYPWDPIFRYWPEWPGWVTVAHEIGHTLGLQHNFESPEYIMSGGLRENSILSPQSIEVLRSSPYFNSPEEPEPEPAPEPEPGGITSFTIALTGGLNFIHVPVNDPDITRVSDVFRALENAFMVIYHDGENFQGYSEPFNKPSDPVNIVLKPSTGLIAVMKPGTAKKVTFEGPAYDDTNVLLKKGKEGLNLVGLPTNDPRIAQFSDLAGLSPRILGITGQNQAGGELKGYPGVDLPIQGGQSVIVIVSDDATLELSGQPWERGPQRAAPALAKAPSLAEQVEQLRTMGITPVLKRPGSLSTTWAKIKQ